MLPPLSRLVRGPPLSMSTRSNLIGLAVGVGAVGGLVALLMGTGVVSLKKNSDEAEHGADEDDSGEADAPRGKSSSRKRGRKGRKKKGRSQSDTVKKLSSMGYVDGTVDADVERSGVVINLEGEAQPGVNFYSSRKQAKAQLVDMQGVVLHEWKSPGMGGWQHVSLQPDGSIIGLVKDKQVFKIDKDSNIQWNFKARAHHDLDVTKDGRIFTLARVTRMMPKYDEKHPTVDDIVIELSPEGEELSRFSILEMIENSPYAFLLGDADSLTARKIRRANPRRNKEYDILHSNHIEVFDGSLAEKNPIFAEGNMLLSPRNTHTIMIANPETKEIVWAWGASQLIFPHHPTVTEAGTILVFNNGDDHTRSQVVEVDPATNDIVWSYGPTEEFFSETRGSNFRMANGNTLITESDTGYVFEVTPEGKIVWEFRNPHVDKKKKLRMAIWRMFRFAPEDLQFKY